MPAVCVVMPVLPDKEDAARAFARDVSGPRAAEFRAFQAASGNTTRETWHLVETADGPRIAVWFDAENPEASFEHMVTSTGFGEWMRERILDVTGIDMSQPDAAAPPELLLDWTA